MGGIVKFGNGSITKWLLSIFSICIWINTVAENWKGACLIQVYKGIGERSECANYGNPYPGRALISRLAERTKVVEEEDDLELVRAVQIKYFC